MKVITVATHSQAYFPILQESARRNNIDLIILGWGDKWAGFGWKLKLIRNYLQSLNYDEIVLVLDAFDTFIASDVKEIIKKYKDLNSPMICAAERKHHSAIWNWTYEKIFNKHKRYPGTPTEYGYLNAGGWISTASYALKLIDQSTLVDSMNDQTLFTSLYVKGLVSIDYNCEIFTCIRKESDLTHVNNKLKNVRTNTYPCMIHAPADVSMKKLISSLGYQPIKYKLSQRAWKYIYSIYAFWGGNSIKDNLPGCPNNRMHSNADQR